MWSFVKNSYIISMHPHAVVLWSDFLGGVLFGEEPYPGADPFSLIRYLESGERLDKPLNEACSQEM